MILHIMDRLTVCYCLLGILVYFAYIVVFWVANEDVLSGSSMTSSVVILASTIDVFSKIISSYLVRRVSLLTAMLYAVSCLVDHFSGS